MAVERDDEAVASVTKKKKEEKKKAQVRTEFRGVRRRGGKYRAQIWDSTAQTMVWLGSFDTAEEAARAHDAAAVKLYGSAAKTNFKTPVSVADDDGIDVPPKKKKAAPAAEKKATNFEVQGGRNATAGDKTNTRSASRSGVYLSGRRDPVQRAKLRLGTFDTAEEAAGAYDEAAVRLYGTSAITNFEQQQPTAAAAPAANDGAEPSSMDLLNDFLELSPRDFLSDGLVIPDGVQLDDFWADLPPDELLDDMDFTDVVA